MNEKEKMLTGAYYWLSMFKAGAIVESVALERVKEELFEQPQLNENQQIVLEYLKSLCPPKLGVSAMVTAYFIANDKINDNWQEYSDEIQEHIEELQGLAYRQQAQVLQSFSQLALEQEEE